MSNILVLEAIGFIDEELLQRSEKKQEQKKRVWIGWAALAACMCLVLAGAWGIFTGGLKTADNCDSENMDPAESAKPGFTKPAIEYSENTTGELVKECEILKARFIQTNPVTEKDKKQILIFGNRQELEEYIAANDTVFAGTNFASVCRQYTSEFFEEKQLVVVALEGNSSSVSHEIANLQRKVDGWNVCINRFYPKAMKMNLVYYHALIEIEAGRLAVNDLLTIQYTDVYADE